MKKLFKEPLLHFLIIGLAMFIVFDLLNDDITNNDKEILVTLSQADLLFFQWATQNGRPPNQQERDGLINHFVLHDGHG
jgi:peptidyl-prolyl cis-trans isomerase C